MRTVVPTNNPQNTMKTLEISWWKYDDGWVLVWHLEQGVMTRLNERGEAIFVCEEGESWKHGRHFNE